MCIILQQRAQPPLYSGELGCKIVLVHGLYPILTPIFHTSHVHTQVNNIKLLAKLCKASLKDFPT